MGWRKTNFYLHWDIFLILLLLYNSFKRQYMNGAGAKIRDKGGAGAGSATLVLRTVLGTKYTLLHFSVSSIRFFLKQTRVNFLLLLPNISEKLHIQYTCTEPMCCFLNFIEQIFWILLISGFLFKKKLTQRSLKQRRVEVFEYEIQIFSGKRIYFLVWKGCCTLHSCNLKFSIQL